MNAQSPENYQRTYELFQQATDRKHGIPVLELGANYGKFVEFLRGQGYDAWGIEGKRDKIGPNADRFVRVGDAECIDKIFADRDFDSIVAQSVFSSQAQFDYQLSNHRLYVDILLLTAVDRKAREELNHSLKQSLDRILAKCFEKLNVGGSMIICEDANLFEHMMVDREDAERVGFKVELYSPAEAIFRKLGN